MDVCNILVSGYLILVLSQLAVAASSAAPTVFDPVRVQYGRHVLVDGGVCVNGKLSTSTTKHTILASQNKGHK